MLAAGFVEKMNAAGIEVQPDAAALIELACQNQLRTGLVAEPSEIADLIAYLTPDIVNAYTFKHGDLPLTFGRVVTLLGDVAERWVELRSKRAHA